MKKKQKQYNSMSVVYRGTKPERNYSLKDFYDNGIFVSWISKFRHHDNKNPFIRCIFRSEGLLGEIRTICDGNTYAVDVNWGWSSDRKSCLTTECKTLRDAKSILFQWFKERGFKKEKQDCGNYLSIKGMQLNLNQFIFRI